MSLFNGGAGWRCCMFDWKPQSPDRLSVGILLAVGLVEIPPFACAKIWLAFVFSSVGVMGECCSVPTRNPVTRGCTGSTLTFSGTSPFCLRCSSSLTYTSDFDPDTLSPRAVHSLRSSADDNCCNVLPVIMYGC